MKVSDSELAMRAGAGDAAAFESLLSRHYDMFYRVAYRLLANVHDAEDVAHDICLALPEKLKSYSARARFTTWAYQVAVNAARDYMRRAKSTRRAHDTWGELAVMEQARAAEQRQNSLWLYQTLGRLGEDLRETAVLVVAEGLSHLEAARVLDIKESTVSWRMHEIRRKLKEMARDCDE